MSFYNCEPGRVYYAQSQVQTTLVVSQNRDRTLLLPSTC